MILLVRYLVGVLLGGLIPFPCYPFVIIIIIIIIIIIRYLVGVLLGGLVPFPCYPFVIAAPCLIFLPLSLIITDTPLWLTMQVGRNVLICLLCF